MQQKAPYILTLVNISKVYKSNVANEIIALDTINVNINKGDFVAIVGKNGCGKSTLLKTISGICKPSAGTINIYGTLAAINDWGSGLETEISGYDNIKMIGRLHRLQKKQLVQLQHFVEGFSELGDRLNEPVKSYSQGMYLRLAFSINAFLDTDILIFDEILAVGDVSFRKKCYSILEKASEEKKTVIIATHNFEELGNSCNRCIWLNGGRIEQDGLPDIVYPMYLKSINTNQYHKSSASQFTNRKPELVEVKKAYLLQKGQVCSNILFWDNAEIIIEWEKKEPQYGISFTIFFSMELNRNVFLSMSDHYGLSKEMVRKINCVPAGVYREVVRLPGGLLNKGSYGLFISASCFIHEDDAEEVSYTTHHVFFNVEDDEKQHENFIWKHSHAPIRLKDNFKRIFVNSLVAKDRNSSN